MITRVPFSVRLASRFCSKTRPGTCGPFYIRGHRGYHSVELKTCLRKLKNSKVSDQQLTLLRRFTHEATQDVTESTILVQQDNEIQEVPVVVFKSDSSKIGGAGTNRESIKTGVVPKLYTELDPKEEAAFVEAFKSYNSPQELLRILDTIPSQEVTPVVAFSVLQKLFELENNFGFRNNGRSWVVAVDSGILETFTRAAIISRLMNTIMSSDNTKIVLDTLHILRTENHQLVQDSEEFMNYHAKFCDYILLKTTKGNLTLEETCRAICSFGEIAKASNFTRVDKKFIDKMWVGIIDQADKINTNNIVEVFKTVPYLQASQRLVLKLVEKNLKHMWKRLDPDTVAQLCDIVAFKQLSQSWVWGVSHDLLMTLSSCAAMNIHRLTEEQLIKIMRGFSSHNFCDETMKNTLIKYMKAKRDRLTRPEFVAQVLDFVKKFRFRSPEILESAAEFVIRSEGRDLSPPEITSVMTAFGHLNFCPEDGYKFWTLMERILHERFIQFTPKDIIDTLLACVYLKKYPINFVPRLYCPNFLDRIHTSDHGDEVLRGVRYHLKILDSTLNIECAGKYGGPFLPTRFTYVSFSVPQTVRVASQEVARALEFIYCDCTVEKLYKIPTLPMSEMFMADVVVIPKKGSVEDIRKFSRRHIFAPTPNLRQSSRSNFLCAIILTPEHFTSDGKYLTGPQAMRIRILKNLGLTVVPLKCQEVMPIMKTPAFTKFLEHHIEDAYRNQDENVFQEDD